MHSHGLNPDMLLGTWAHVVSLCSHIHVKETVLRGFLFLFVCTADAMIDRGALQCVSQVLKTVDLIVDASTSALKLAKRAPGRNGPEKATSSFPQRATSTSFARMFSFDSPGTLTTWNQSARLGGLSDRQQCQASNIPPLYRASPLSVFQDVQYRCQSSHISLWSWATR